MLEIKNDDEQVLILLNEINRVRERIINERKSKKLLKKCEAIELYLINNSLSNDKIVKYKYKIITLEREIDDANSESTYIRLILITGAVTILLPYAMKLEFENPAYYDLNNRYLGLFLFVLIGLVGMLTKFLLDKYRERKSPEYQFLIAITFPVVFVNIFIYENNQIQGFNLVNLLIFVCGFSVEFILLFLNRLVDVAKKAFNLEDYNKASVTTSEVERKEIIEKK